MRFQGGKHIASKYIAPFLTGADGHHYLEPFVGGGSVLVRVAADHSFETLTAGDIHEDLILMWKAVQAGRKPPVAITRQQWDDLRNASPSALRGFVGYAASFGGKWFNAHPGIGVDHRHTDATSRWLVKHAPLLKGIRFVHASYETWAPERGWVVYCDPPYNGTAKHIQAGVFDHDRYLETIESWARHGAIVFCSEYAMPIGEIVWERETPLIIAKRMGGEHANRTQLERLYRL